VHLQSFQILSFFGAHNPNAYSDCNGMGRKKHMTKNHNQKTNVKPKKKPTYVIEPESKLLGPNIVKLKSVFLFLTKFKIDQNRTTEFLGRP
jgi:hypothetical protein